MKLDRHNRIAKIVSLLLLLSTVLGGCHINQTGTSSEQQPTESSETVISTLPSQSEGPSASQPSTEKEWTEQEIKTYPFVGEWDYHPMELSVKGDILPDSICPIHSEDQWSGRTIHITSLQVDLTIPDGFYLYRIPGEYYNAESDRFLTLEFVDEYVFTIRDVTKEQLIQDIRGYYRSPNPMASTDYRGPGYIVYSFRVFRKEYLPIESLFLSSLADSGECFTAGDYYCSMGVKTWGMTEIEENGQKKYYSSNIWDGGYQVWEAIVDSKENWPVDGWIAALVNGTDQHGIMSYSLIDPSVTTIYKPLFFGNYSMFRRGTSGYVCQLDYTRNGISGSLFCGNSDTSVCNDEWWQLYQNALTELKEHPELYQDGCLNLETVLSRPTPITTVGAEDFIRYDENMRQNWYQDYEKDQKIRAMVFANRALYYPLSLNDVSIVLRDGENGELFYGALIALDSSRSRWTAIEWNQNALDEAGLDFARQYAEKYLVPQEYEVQLVFEEGVPRESLSNEEIGALEDYFRVS